MIIYLDLILILNFVIDFMLLLGVSLLLKRKTPLKKILLSSLIGSLSTILLFYFHSNLLLLIYKVATSMLITLLAFNYETFTYFKENLFWLYILSIILGGSMYLINNQITLSNEGLIFSPNGFKKNILILFFISFILIYFYLKEQKKYKINYSNYYDVSIYYNDVKISGLGFLDTGNKLVDPIFNKPIILINESLIHEQVKTHLIPYDTLNKHNLLKVFKPKYIKVNDHIKRNILVGLSDVNLNGVKIILNMEAI